MTRGTLLPPQDLSALLRREVARAAGMPVEAVGGDKPLLALGLDSLALIELQHALERALGVSIPVEELLDGIDLAGLERLVQAALEAGGSRESTTAAWGGDRELPLSAGQLALWSLEQVAGESGLLHIAAVVRVRQTAGRRLDSAALGRCLAALAERHPTLLATFHERADGPVQRFGTGRLPELVEVDASEKSAAELAAWSEHEAYRPFDLATGPLLRVAIARRAGGEDAMVFAIHHVVADFWSVAVLVRDLSALYLGRTLPPLPLTYGDYLRRQAERLAGAEGERLRAYWREQLSPAPESLALPSDRPRPAVRSFRGGAVLLSLGGELSARLATLARRGDTTLFATLLAGFQALLSRSTGQRDLLVGSPAAGRTRHELAGLAGYFVHLMPLRADLAGNPTFMALLAQARRRVLAALAHQELPLAWLAERLRSEHDPAGTPMLQACCVLQKSPARSDPALAAFAIGARGARLPFGGLELESWELAERWSQFDLVLRMAEVNGSLAASLQHSADLFDPTTAARMLGHLRELLTSVAADPERPLSDLPWLAPPERHQLLAEWNDTTRETAPGPWVHELFAEQARRRPEAPAVVDGARQVSYGELARWARRISSALSDLGVQPEVRVGVCLERSPELIAACLGVLQAGAAYVALDPSYPEEWLRLRLADSQVPVLLTQCGPLAELAAAQGIHCLCPRELGETGLEDGLPEPAPPVLEPGNLAYVIFTSGSTGRPKGVDLSHGSLLNLVAAQRRLLGVGAADRTTLLAGVGYDATILEIWAYLAAGASLHIPPETLRTSPAELLGWMTEQGITAGFLPTVLAEGILDLGWGRDRVERTALRCVLTGGDRLHRYASEALPFRLINAYGPTEATVMATTGHVPAGEHSGWEGRAPTIGRPLDGVRIRIVDAGELRPVPMGVPGELLIGGAGLARGYLRRPAMTAERFVPDPLATAGGERLYRTGDLARWSPDGEIEFLGRIDHQVKIRGQRIEPGELESVLALHPAVREAAVLVVDGRLVAYTVSRDTAAPGAAELRSFLAARLPAHMLPAVLVDLEELPLTRSGKLDRRALPAPGSSPPESSYVAPRSAFEAALASIWTEVLGSEHIGIHDNFFALGGHSLRATQVLSKVRAGLGVELPVRSLFETPTIAELSVAIVKEQARRAGLESLSSLLAEVEDT